MIGFGKRSDNLLFIKDHYKFDFAEFSHYKTRLKLAFCIANFVSKPHTLIRNRRPQVFCLIALLKNFTKFIEKLLYVKFTGNTSAGMSF